MLREILEGFNKEAEFSFMGLDWKVEFSMRVAKFLLMLKNTDGEWVAYQTANKMVSSKSAAIIAAREIIKLDNTKSYKRIARLWNVV